MVTIEVQGLCVYPGRQSEVAYAYPQGGPRHGIAVATRYYDGGWVRYETDEALTSADIEQLVAAPRVDLCG